MTARSSVLAGLLGPNGPAICNALDAARDFLSSTPVPELLRRVGQTITELPQAAYPDKRLFQASFQGDITRPPDDLLTGQGLFYVTEQRKLFLDCTAGHYQMTWGYQHPQLMAWIRDGMDQGIVWDDHNNIPGSTVKRLAERLVEVVNSRTADAQSLDVPAALNTVCLLYTSPSPRDS